MKYQAGDDILILHTNEEGKVIEIISDKMLLVEVRGVRFPVYTDQVDFPYFKRFTKNKVIEQKKKEKVFVDDIPKEKPVPNQIKSSAGVWLSLIPKFTTDDFGDETPEFFKLYLVNKTGIGYHFIYVQYFLGNKNFELDNTVTAFHDFYLHDIQFSDFNDSPEFFFDLNLITPDKTKADFHTASVKLKAKQLFKRIAEMREKNEPAILFKLFDEYPFKQKEEKTEVTANVARHYAFYEAEKIKQNLEPARTVIDLHMDKLSDDWQKMDNFEILTMQLLEFEKWYHLAIAHRQDQLVVIHGVGSGKLRDEIHDILKTKDEVKYFVNQFHPSYGYGATEIYFKYK